MINASRCKVSQVAVQPGETQKKRERGTVSVHFLNLLVVVYSCLIATFPQAACIVQAGFFSEKVER